VGKNIILLSDGTGNSSAKIFKTNVWRLYQALDLTKPTGQIAYYDDGVGTSSFKLFAALGGIFGFGLKRNVVDIYSFCCRNYQKGDKLYGFGFSRGAFTIRIVAGFIARTGLVKYNGNDNDLARDAKTAYRDYRRQRNFHSGIFVKPFRAIRDFISHTILRRPTIQAIERTQIDKFHFLGVWDTVGAYGGPSEEVTRAIDYYYLPLSMPDQFMNHKVTRACHALGLEEERDSFTPVLWDDRYVRREGKLHLATEDWKPEPANPSVPLAPIDQERISQVWFVGVHSDTGGGYPQDGLSYLTLKWMMERAEVYGLTYLALPQDILRAQANPYDKLNDSRHGFAGYYRYKPRNLRNLYRVPPYKLSFSSDVKYVLGMLKNKEDPDDDLRKELGREPAERPVPKVHELVLDRIAKGNDGYAPIVLPKTYDVVTHAGGLVRNTATTTDKHADTRATRQGKVWDWVWSRRIVYFLTVFSSLYLVALPLIEKWRPGGGAASRFEFVIPLIDLVGNFLPNFAKFWLDAFRNSPGRFTAGVALVIVLMIIGAWMQTHIRDLMREIWKKPAVTAVFKRSAIYRLRSAGPYKAFWYVVKGWILPFVFATVILVVLLWLGLSLASRISFGLFDTTGNVCATSQSTKPVTAATTVPFETRALCAPTGLAVERGKSYRITVAVTEPWEDGYKFDEPDPRKAKGIETGPEGFGYDKMTWKMAFGLPIRRHISANWFEMMGRVGNKGFGAIDLNLIRKDPPPCECPAGPPRYTATFKARRTGELLFYVNDSVIGWPGYFDLFYRLNNKGKADVTVELLPD